MTTKKKTEKEIFTLCMRVSNESATVYCTKDGKEAPLDLIEGKNLRKAYESMKFATGLVACRYVDWLHTEGEMSDEEYHQVISGKS